VTKSYLQYFLGTFLIFVCLVVGINLWVNPYSYYGQMSLGKPHTHNDRLSKSIFILENNIKIEALLLGSSNSMRFYPDWLEKSFNLSSYNFGLFQASVEDFYCVTNFVLQKNPGDLKLVVFNLDDWNFSKIEFNSFNILHPANNRLTSVNSLARFLDNYEIITYNLSKLKTAISFDQLSASVLNIMNLDFKRKRISTDNVFYQNGVRINYSNSEGENITDLAEKGNYDISTYLAKRHKLLQTFPGADKLESQEFFKEFSNERIMLFESLMKLLKERNVKVIINIMPIQPYEQSIVEKETNYIERMDFMIDWLNNLKAKNENILLVKNNSQIEFFNGFENHFFDAIHPTSVNSKLMFESIIKNLPKDAI